MIAINAIDANDMLMEAELDDTLYYIGLSWNSEANQWTLSLRNLNQTILAAGLSVVPNWPMLGQVRRPEFPDGEIVAINSDHKPITRQSLTNGHTDIVYLSLDDIADASF